MAILTLLIVVLNNTEIEIRTDSLNAINNIEKFEVETSLRKLLKLKNYRILKNIKTIKNLLKLQCKFTKVKAHDGIPGNEEVDILAKEGTEDYLISNKNLIGTNSYNFHWYGIIVEEDIKNFLINEWKEQYKKEENKLRRMEQLKNIVDNKMSFEIWKLNLNNEEKEKLSLLKKSERKCFKLKRMLDELPILEKLKIRKKAIYHQNLKCVRCNLKEENMSHV